jgi:hypothetical protein
MMGLRGRGGRPSGAFRRRARGKVTGTRAKPEEVSGEPEAERLVVKICDSMLGRLNKLESHETERRRAPQRPR